MILNVNNFSPNDQTQNIVDSISDCHSQMRELEESTKSSDIDLVDNADISRTENLSVTEEPTSSFKTDSTDEVSSIDTTRGINTTSNNDSSHTENQSSFFATCLVRE